jgi:hypothetical protein
MVHFNLKRNSEKTIQPAEGGLVFIALGCQDHSEKRAGISRPDPVQPVAALGLLSSRALSYATWILRITAGDRADQKKIPTVTGIR